MKGPWRNQLRHELSTAKTLIHRAFSLPTTQDDREKEIQHITNTLLANGYPKKVISTFIKSKEPNPAPQPEQLVKEFFDMVEPPIYDRHFATLPYIKGITEPLTRILRRYDIKVTNKPVRTLEQQFPSHKHRVPLEQTTNVIYRIPCADYCWSYVGETGRSFETRKKEHIRKVKYFA